LFITLPDMFAKHYFEKSEPFKSRISERIEAGTSLIVIIPCFMEPDILKTLQSLHACTPIQGHAEVIILINESENCTREVSDYNKGTLHEILHWIKGHPLEWLKFHPVGPVKLPQKWAGVGLARKTAMDEALYRFNILDFPEGIIVSLDADTLVEKNYFQAITEHFRIHQEDVGATVSFIHQTEGFPARQIQGIRLYEQYLWYYKNALEYCGYPHALYTIGSAFAVKAEAYMKRGGMTRRKAGEDFYFLQTLTQTGHVGEINNTCVYPSARVSQRVPFGTGPFMKKWMDGSEDGYSTYNFQAFRDLKEFFEQRFYLFRMRKEDSQEPEYNWSESILAYLKEENLWEDFEKLSENCSREEVFNDRFFQVFNAFRILKFLNFAHPEYYARKPLEECILELKLTITKAETK
jgi:hypothetical protein